MDNNPNDYVYAIYEGYFSKDDYGDKPGTVVDMVYLARKYYIINYPRRNADVWLYLKKSNELQGWVQLIDTQSGFKQQSDGWRYFNAEAVGQKTLNNLDDNVSTNISEFLFNKHLKCFILNI